MAETRPVQCTERTECPDNGHVTSVPHDLLNLSDGAVVLSQDNREKELHIKDLHQKIQQLEQQLIQAGVDKDEEICALGRLLEDRQGGGHESGLCEGGITPSGATGVDRCEGRMTASGGMRVDRDLNQKLLLTNANLLNENRELREMYEKVTEDLRLKECVARQCLQMAQKNSALEQELLWIKTLFAHKERECEIGQKKLKEMQHFQAIMNTKAARSVQASTGFADLSVLDLQEEDEHSIRLREQTSPPLKRGRFTMQKTYLHECSKCSSFFETKEEAKRVPCCYHSKGLVPAILRNGSNSDTDLSKCSDVFWPCCKQLGRNATKCVLNGTHRFETPGFN